MKQILYLFAFSMATALLPAQQLTFKSGDRILLYGNSFIERMQEAGALEARMQLAHPDLQLSFRSLAWTGDEAGHRLRPEGYPGHLKKLLAEWPAQHVIVAMGMNESFRALPGLNDFKADLSRYLQELKRRHPDTSLTCLSIMAIEENPYNKASRQNSYIEFYNQVIQTVAQEERVGYVDTFHASKSIYAQNEQALTVDGQHLTPQGHLLLSKHIVAALLGADVQIDQDRLAEVSKAVSHKHGYNATLTRPVNAVVYYGVRARPNEYKAEMPRYHTLLKKSEDLIHQLAQHPESQLEQHLPLRLPPMEAGNPRKAKKGVGQIFSPTEQQATIKVADGYALNLFASESDFPEMKNPVQIATDHRGRLWVVTMPSWPHTIPGEQPSDKIIILEDTDKDGKADRCTTFADGLNVPDGLAFYKDGVIISAQPRLVFMKDTDGDDVADIKEEWLRGIDVTDAHHGGMIQLSPIGDVMFCDGVFHRSQLETPFGVTRGIDATTYRFNPQTRSVRREYQTLTPNPWKMTFDRWGNLHHMYGDGYVQDSHAIPWTPFGVYHPFGRSISIKYGKGSGACAISSPNFPDAYQDGMASATLLGSYFVAISKMSADAGPFNASDRLDIVSSSNAAFRPVDMAFGFDGAMLISDFCSPIIGHAQHPMRDPQWDHEHGRIWRVVHTEKPLVKDYPKIAGASTAELLQLLKHPMDLIREHARNQLRLVGNLDEHLDAYAANLYYQDDDAQRQALLECLRLYVEHGLVRTKVFNSLLSCDDPMTRAGALHLLRFQPKQGPTPMWLKEAAKDPHPRVRLQLMTTLSHLQESNLEWAAILGQIKLDDAPALKQVLADASHGVDSARGPEVPILEKPSGARIDHWLMETENGFVHYDETSQEKPKVKGLHLRNWLNTAQAQRAILSVKTGYVTVHVNGLPVLESATFWSSDWNIQVELQKGLNEIEVQFGNAQRARGPAPVYLYNARGQLIADAVHAYDDSSLREMRRAYLVQQGISEDEIRISAVPGQLAFSPRSFKVKAGETVNLTFTNGDLAMHNLIILNPGTADAVGRLADKLAADPNGLARQYVPESQHVLWATELLNPKASETLSFTAPEPGRYPILCTFPGHWRVMRGEMIVE